MSTARRPDVVRTIEREKVSAIIRTKDQQMAGNAMEAAVNGGIRIIEFTMTTPGALELIARFSEREGIIVGAGTVLTQDQARQAKEAGAAFLVSPITDPQIVDAAADLDVACIPGAQTPTEMESAHRLGADFVKVFPEPAGGVGFIQAIRGPLPHLRLFPTAGPNPDNFLEYLEAGCAGVGLVRTLFVPDDLERGDFDSIRMRADKVSQKLRASRFAP